MPQWLQREPKEEEERKIELKPEDMQKALEPHLTKISTDMDAKLSPVLEFINQQREAAAAKEQEEARRKQSDRQRELQVNPEDYITDPEGAIDKKLQPLMDRNAAMAALLVRRETLEKKEFYDDPVFKAKVDALIDSQPLNSRSNASVVMNCYKTVYFDSLEDIKAGKIKSELSGGTRGSTGSHSGDTKEEKKDDLSNEERVYARKLGISEAAWAKQKRELEYV